MTESKRDVTFQIKGVLDKPDRQFFCDHYNIILDEESRLLACADCKLIMDGFGWLLAWAKTGRRLKFEIGWLTEDRNKLRSEIEELKRQRNNLKSQIKRRTK